MIIDTHCHLDEFSDSQELLRNQLLRFKQQNYPAQLLSMSVSPDCWHNVIQLSSAIDSVHASLGIHPWFVDSKSLSSLDTLNTLLSSSNVMALGEIGLDFSSKYRHTDSLQLDVLEGQLALAKQNSLPVSIHVVKAHNEMFKLLRHHNVVGCIHGLGSSTQVAKRYVELGFKIGVNPILLRANARRYHELVRCFGLEHIVLETDYPNITAPGLSQPQLSDIILVAEKVASLLNETVDTVIEVTSHNAIDLFKFNGMKYAR